MRRGVLSILLLALAALQSSAAESAPSGELAFSRLTDGYWQVWVRDLATGRETQITRSPGDKRGPAWDPTGLLYFRAANDEVWRWERSSGDVSPVLQAAWPLLDVAISTDGAIAAIQAHPGMQNATTLVLLDGEGQLQRALTPGAAFRAHPAWSPTGRELAFVRSRSSQKLVIQTVPVEEGAATELIGGPGQKLRPAYAPDGERLAYASDSSGDFEIWVSSASVGGDGEAHQRLTSSPGLDTSPAWSADGSQIAFTSRRSGTLAIWVMGSDGSNQRPLIDSAPSMDPAWH